MYWCSEKPYSSPNSGDGLKVTDPKDVCRFLLHVLKSAESTSELTGLDADSLATECIQVNKM